MAFRRRAGGAAAGIHRRDRTVRGATHVIVEIGLIVSVYTIVRFFEILGARLMAQVLAVIALFITPIFGADLETKAAPAQMERGPYWWRHDH